MRVKEEKEIERVIDELNQYRISLINSSKNVNIKNRHSFDTNKNNNSNHLQQFSEILDVEIDKIKERNR